MRTVFGVRNVFFAVPLLASLAAATVSLPSRDLAVSANAATVAAAGNLTYYSNASHTTVVGRFGYDCCNNHVAWGKKTQFVTSGGCFPCIPPPP